MIHLPVLFNEVMNSSELKTREVEFVFDGTFGRGGHTKGFLEKYKNAKVYAVDRDEEAIAYGRMNFSDDNKSGRLTLIHADYCELKQLMDSQLIPNVTFDLILLDLGVSSPQLDQANRGFSFQQDGPLDMRMNLRDKKTAAEIINEWGEEELEKLFREYGDIESPMKVVRAIVHDRRTKPFDRTSQLAGLIERVDGWRKKGYHPATQYFMALRLEVNGEIHRLESALCDAMSVLSVGGRLLVITFHSLEDRIVKNVFAQRSDLGFPWNKRVIVGTDEEVKNNPRARSAKLRVLREQKVLISKEKKTNMLIKRGIK